MWQRLIYHLISEKLFPVPVKIGARAVAFMKRDIEEGILLTNSNPLCKKTTGVLTLVSKLMRSFLLSG
ncbi:helix-turn-helix transcriptional regulator [Pantoea agglomerans]|uniref:helix-turn-helix transcriptional regulator n=1 Tax=Enterobacter agglomerans TaxID=549 RepID=UPI003988E59B